MADRMVCPPVTLDPRFRAGRTLVQTGRAGEGGIDIFETLVQECRREFGEASVEAAACYFEYGNALFRAAARMNEAEEEATPDDEDEKKPAAVPATKEEEGSEQEENSGETVTENTKEENENADAAAENDEDSVDDVGLALEMMETTWSILDKHVTEESNGQPTYVDWARDQLPRILLGIGDVLSFQGRQADAADAYSRAIPHREAALEKYKDTELELDHLQNRRRLVEANVLVAEALLACPPNEDVVTTETKDLLVKASERVEYARGYYDKARDELQETVFLMGKIAASGKDIGSEKEDVCFISTLLMGVGSTLAEIDEAKAQEEAGDLKPAAKKQKT